VAENKSENYTMTDVYGVGELGDAVKKISLKRLMITTKVHWHRHL